MGSKVGLLHDRRGVAAVEFAILSIALIALCVGTIEVGLLWWGKSALQAAAAETARCRAIGASSCTTDANAKTYAVSLVTQWMMSGVVNTSNVSLYAKDSTHPCYSGDTGNFEVVTIQTTFLADRLPSFVTELTNRTLSVKACYPKT